MKIWNMEIKNIFRIHPALLKLCVQVLPTPHPFGCNRKPVHEPQSIIKLAPSSVWRGYMAEVGGDYF